MIAKLVAEIFNVLMEIGQTDAKGKPLQKIEKVGGIIEFGHLQEMLMALRETIEVQHSELNKHAIVCSHANNEPECYSCKLKHSPTYLFVQTFLQKTVQASTLDLIRSHLEDALAMEGQPQRQMIRDTLQLVKKLNQK